MHDKAENFRLGSGVMYFAFWPLYSSNNGDCQLIILPWVKYMGVLASLSPLNFVLHRFSAAKSCTFGFKGIKKSHR